MPIPDGYTVTPNWMIGEGLLGGIGAIGTVYYVDGNAGDDGNDGLSWATAFKTLAVAMAASHANIAADSTGWASRNRIYIKGDSFVEDLTKLAQKTDVIGVGSCDHHDMPRIIGNHVIDTTSYMGCRFFNVAFKPAATGGVVMNLPTQQSGIGFYGCLFDGRSTVAATKAILATAIEQLTIQGCRFIGKYSTTTIEIGAGSSRALLIKDNIIESGAIGITVNAGLTCADADAMILNNVFDVVTLVVDENSDKVLIGGNRGKTAADGTEAATIDYNAALAWDNIITHSAGTSIYPALAAIPT
jgi:hypothetical protein